MNYVLITGNRNYSSWSLRPWLLMKALGIPFENRVEPFTKSSNYDDFRTFSPNGKVPALIDGDRTIWDSLAIILYLADRHQGVWPTDPDARAWAMSAVAEMHSGFAALRNERTMNVGVRVRAVPASPDLAADIARIDELWGEGQRRFGGPWLAGSLFTVVDAFFAPVAYRVRTYDIAIGRAQRAWVDRVLAHPAALQWEAEALAEDWREADHEAELKAAGVVTADFRAG